MQKRDEEARKSKVVYVDDGDALTRGILGATHKKKAAVVKRFSHDFFAAFSERETEKEKERRMHKNGRMAGDRRPEAEEFFHSDVW